MDFSGRYRIAAPPKIVWAALRDPAILAEAIPGCESVERLSDHVFAVRALLALGPAETRFDGQVQCDEQVAATGFTHALRVHAEGRNAAQGSLTGDSEVRLAAEGDGTLLIYDAHAALGGDLSGTADGTGAAAAKILGDRFFAALTRLAQARLAQIPAAQIPAAQIPAAQIQAQTPPAHASPVEKPAPAAHSEDLNTPGEEGLAPQIWIAGLITIVIILLILFGIVL